MIDFVYHVHIIQLGGIHICIDTTFIDSKPFSDIFSGAFRNTLLPSFFVCFLASWLPSKRDYVGPSRSILNMGYPPHNLKIHTTFYAYISVECLKGGGGATEIRFELLIINVKI